MKLSSTEKQRPYRAGLETKQSDESAAKSDESMALVFRNDRRSSRLVNCRPAAAAEWPLSSAAAVFQHFKSFGQRRCSHVQPGQTLGCDMFGLVAAMRSRKFSSR